MQERYLGDSHDFLKYSLLRALGSKLDARTGVNWYLTSPETVDRPGNNDGEKRHHLSGRAWRGIDPELFDLIKKFEHRDSRRLANIFKWNILPSSTVSFDEPVPTSDRQQWLARSLSHLSDADIIFVDPDNGFEVPSMTARTRSKYALYEEISALVRAGKTVIAIQLARQCDPIKRANEIRARLIDRHGGAGDQPVIRGRVAPNILFFTVAAQGNERIVDFALREFANHCSEVALAHRCPTKIEIID